MSASSLKGRINSAVKGNNKPAGALLHFTDAGICILSQYLLAFLVLSFAGLAIFSVAYPSTISPSIGNQNSQSDRMNAFEAQYMQVALESFKVTLIDKTTSQPIKYSKFLQFLNDGDQQLLSTLTNAILHPGFSAVFWECTPVRMSELDKKDFEFVVISAPVLAKRTVDDSNFRTKFHEHNALRESAISFQNLGKDATLIVPSPPTTGAVESYMTHLASFLRSASPEHKLQFWMLVGEEMLRNLYQASPPDRVLWLSTSGLGVSWLHVRIDIIPKYYNWVEYTQGK